MTNIEVELTLPEQDVYLVEIEKQIAQKRNFLLQRRQQLEVSAKENTFLNNVKEDYQKYHQFIVKQKQDQVQAMQLLDQYLNDLMVSGKMTQHDILQSKKDQQDILSEIDKIKKDLDGIILSTKSY
jgi:Tfp pilus assembly pilus retraction ATPase PilT